jgi:glycosyltransferase involved in cell wall biosynthesis
MTLTEAAACGTPSVVTDIAGHRDSAERGVSGLLVRAPAELAPALTRVLLEPELRACLSRGALEHAGRFTWQATARETFRILAAEADRFAARHRGASKRGKSAPPSAT